MHLVCFFSQTNCFTLSIQASIFSPNSTVWQVSLFSKMLNYFFWGFFFSCFLFLLFYLIKTFCDNLCVLERFPKATWSRIISVHFISIGLYILSNKVMLMPLPSLFIYTCSVCLLCDCINTKVSEC